MQSKNDSFQYEKEFEVLSFQVDPSGKLRWSALADMLQEVAWKHADSRNFGQKLFDLGFMWVLSRFDIQVNEMPSWGNDIKIETAGRGINKLFAMREFRVKDSHGKILASAMSAWLLLDIEKKRPQKPEKVLPAELFQPILEEEFLPEKLKAPSYPVFGRNFQVNFSDLDMNNHVNNVSYIRWIEDFCKEKDFKFNRLLINYQSEAILGEIIEIQFEIDSKKIVISGISNGRVVFNSLMTNNS